MDQRDDPQRHQRIAEQHPGERGIRQLAPAAVENGGERPRRPLPHVDPREDLLARLGERVLVRGVEPEERRHVQVLLVLVGEVAAAQELEVALAEGVVQLRDHAGERAVAAVAPVEADRVEDEPEHAELRQHEHPLDLRVAGELEHRLLQRLVAVEVVAVVEGDDVAAVHGEELQPPLELRELVEIEQPGRDRIA